MDVCLIMAPFLLLAGFAMFSKHAPGGPNASLGFMLVLVQILFLIGCIAALFYGDGPTFLDGLILDGALVLGFTAMRIVAFLIDWAWDKIARFRGTTCLASI